MAETYGVLTVEAVRGGTVAEIRAYLEAAEDAYNNLYALDILTNRVREVVRDASNSGYKGKGRKPNFRTIKPLKAVDNLVLPEDRLRLSSVVIQSPGIWEFLGALNILEVIRNSLNDRHERKKDADYRNDFEKERLFLENQRLLTEAIRNYAQAMREFNVPEEQIRQVVAEHGYNFLSRLDAFQDSDLIGGASIRRVNERNRYR